MTLRGTLRDGTAISSPFDLFDFGTERGLDLGGAPFSPCYATDVGPVDAEFASDTRIKATIQSVSP